MGLSDWASLALICLLGASSPGPSLIVILGNTRLYGRKAGLYASIGHGLGVWIYALLAATTLGLILTHYQMLFTLIQGAGALLLVWIGGKLLYAILLQKNAPDTPPAPVASLRHSFRDGLAIALLNPKIATFFASLLSQFITPEQNLLTHFAMASMAGFIDAAVYILMVYIASTSASQNWLGRYQKQIDFSFAILLLGLGLSLFISQINRLL
jgi:threonine/homoserine/homoserine lactone efflux protein